MDSRFQETIKRVAGKIREKDDFLVVSHHDADGVTACAIIVDALKTLGKKTEYVILKQLERNTIEKVCGTEKTVIFTDMGSGQLGLIEEKGIRDFFVIDHHPPEKEYEQQINPHFYGYDGGSDVSAAGLAYFTARALGCRRMAAIAVVGAVGDMQDSEGHMHSLNTEIIEDATEEGLLKVKKDLRIFGRQSRPLPQMLAYSSDPILPGLTGDETACAAFLQELGIEVACGDRPRAYVDLSFPERQALMSAIYVRLLDAGIPEYIIQSMVGDVYTLVKEEKGTELRDAKEFASLLNACGRQEKPETGVAVCLGDRGEAWHTARSILQTHRKSLRDGITLLKETGAEDRGTFQFFDSEGGIPENIIGVIAGMAYGARIVSPDKPILAFADDRDDASMLKVSGRANWGLVRRGIHLGNALREETRKLGGDGGGHDIAAGARIPKNRKEEFLSAMDAAFKKQLGA